MVRQFSVAGPSCRGQVGEALARRAPRHAAKVDRMIILNYFGRSKQLMEKTAAL
jgi:hypothetical protein